MDVCCVSAAVQGQVMFISLKCFEQNTLRLRRAVFYEQKDVMCGGMLTSMV